MPKRHLLKLDSTDDYFGLIGIASQLKDYRLVFMINKALGHEFRRIEDMFVSDNKQNTPAYPCYHYYNTDLKASLIILANKKPGCRLVPEIKNVDYFFLTDSCPTTEIVEEQAALLRKVNGILTAFLIRDKIPDIFHEIFPILEISILKQIKEGKRKF